MTQPFGTLADGRAVQSITIQDGALKVTLLDLGALIQDVRLDGVDHPLTLGGQKAASYDGAMSHFGAIMGPVANRISGAEAQIAGRTYRFEANQDGAHTRHSGAAGTHKKIWQVSDYGDAHVTFTLDLPDGQGGFPGNRTVTARYSVTDTTLTLELSATTDAPTLINLANHAYWTLHNKGDWGGQTLQIHADRYLPSTDDNLPKGDIAATAGSAYDFRAPVRLDLATTPKLDTNFCLADGPRALSDALSLSSESGLRLDIATTAPGVQLFDMGTIDTGDAPTIHHRPYRAKTALAIEPQHWPDAPGRSNWPSIVLQPQDTYRQMTTYRFSRP